MKSNSSVVVGLEYNSVPDIAEAIQQSKESHQADYNVIPLFHPRFRRDATAREDSSVRDSVSETRLGPATRSDRELQSKDWISKVVGRVSDWIDPDNGDASIQKSAELTLRGEINWALHLGLQAIVLPTPRLFAPNYARMLTQICNLNAPVNNAVVYFQELWVKIPILLPMTYHYEARNPNTSPTALNDGWLLWDNFRQLTGYNHRIGVVLELTGNEDNSGVEIELLGENYLRRWAAEPVKAVSVPTSLFVFNKAGYPVLSRAVQRFVEFFFEYGAQVIVRGVGSSSDDGNSRPGAVPVALYVQYIRHLKSTYLNNRKLNDAETFTRGYRDRLQAPLQPLIDNLESQTYEVFEKDPIKYVLYEQAITQALRDIQQKRKSDCEKREANSIYSSDMVGTAPSSSSSSSSSSFSSSSSSSGSPFHPVVVCVVGAGRGPLVAAALSASILADVPIRVYAVEKNENAVITLRNRILSERWTNVSLVAADMRDWRPAELCDIMVSELLGSLGDNELSPECLDGAQKCLKRGGISIPCSYTSFIAPVATSLLWMGANEFMKGTNVGLETTFVVLFHRYFQFAAAERLFTFEHPHSLDSPESSRSAATDTASQPPQRRSVDNSRFKTVSFTAAVTMTMHGLAGYFESTLYGDTIMSILPETHSAGMVSWFPLFIPLATPVRVNRGDVITAAMWRCSDNRKVWYEWCLTSPVNTPIQNSNGRSCSIGL